MGTSHAKMRKITSIFEIIQSNKFYHLVCTVRLLTSKQNKQNLGNRNENVLMRVHLAVENKLVTKKKKSRQIQK